MPEFKPRFTATGIGTLPYTDPAQAVDTVLAQLTEMPYWPQLPARSHLEDMNSQYAPALTPLLVVGEAGQVRANPAAGREEALAGFLRTAFQRPVGRIWAYGKGSGRVHRLFTEDRPGRAGRVSLGQGPCDRPLHPGRIGDRVGRQGPAL